MAKQKYSDEEEDLRKYIQSPSSENAKTMYLHPIFKKIFKDKFKIETDANEADGYVEGQLIIETKTNFNDWTKGLFQALHYEQKHGLSFHSIFVLTKDFVGIWRVNKLPANIKEIAYTTNRDIAPSKAGEANAKRITAKDKLSIKESSELFVTPSDFIDNMYREGRSYTYLVSDIKDILISISEGDEYKRTQINLFNFIGIIEQMKRFFQKPIDAVHAFYTIVAFWDITSTIIINDDNKITLLGFQQTKNSRIIDIHQKNIPEFKKFVENKYIRINGGSGIRTDDYFSRFDEVLSTIDSEYVKQHGIFFTDNNLSKFALWFAKKNLDENINEDYIVFDPAGGSGNLVSSWKGHLRHKIISELEPDLLKTIERRLEADPYHINTGFTIIPKTSSGEGLNFLDTSAEVYLNKLYTELSRNNQLPDKPFVFLLNPPYKNIKENENKRDIVNYKIHDSIINITGEQAITDRYLAFLAQIINISEIQSKTGLNPIVMIFTPTSWLIPRPEVVQFKKMWDTHFNFKQGFIITSNEFFKLDGKWPLAFTMWNYDFNENRNNDIKILDLTDLNRANLNVNWIKETESNNILNKICEVHNTIILTNKKENIRSSYGLKLYDFIRTPTKTEKDSNDIIGGLPLKDTRRQSNSKTYGVPDSDKVGLLGDCTPVRIRTRGDLERFTYKCLHSIWFRIDTAFKDVNRSKCFNAPADNRSYCANDLESAKKAFTWFCITKSLNGKYPLWANQFDIWKPNIKSELEKYWYSLCYAYALSENRCVVTNFEKDNPVKGAPEIIIDNPLSPIHPNNFWHNVLETQIVDGAGKDLVNSVKELYNLWNHSHTKGRTITAYELKEESYFKYFDYDPFLTPHSGLIQIKKYAEKIIDVPIIEQFKTINAHTKKVRNELYVLLVEEFKYFN